MKFVHMADMHFDIPFTVLNSRNKLGDKRRLEQREAFKTIIEYIKENNIDYLFIAGDLYENEYIRRSTIDYINNLFKEIPNTKIYITPGNHDPYINGSMYKSTNWSDNVKIFTNNIEKVENEDCNIYGFGFNNFYCRTSDVQDIVLDDKEKVNILITHGTLNGGTIEDMEYNPMSKSKLSMLGFDYIALGHIHKLDYNTEENQKIVYPGSPISMGFDELGKHGVIVGELTKEKLDLKFMQIDKREFKEEKVDISDTNNIEELIEKLNGIELDDNIFYKIILTGEKKYEININNLFKYINNENIIKIKNETKLKLDLESLSRENSLKGLFVKKVLEELNEENYDKNTLENVLEIGLNILDNNK